MVATATSLQEAVDSIAPSKASFSPKGGRATASYILDDLDSQDLQDLIPLVLGSTSTEVGDGRLQRTPPFAHPTYPWLYAVNISDIHGVGQESPVSSNQELEVPPLLEYSLYDTYQMTVEYAPLPYPVLQDEEILVQQVTWYDSNGVQHETDCATEWWRYTNYSLVPQNDWITAQLGEFKFRTPTSGPPGNPPRSFNGKPRIRLPNQILKFTWFQVPFRYIESADSWIDQAVGTINQLDWYGWPKGSLLYVGYNPIRYSPPVPSLDPWEDGQAGVFAVGELCDIEFTFLLTTRALPAADEGFVPANPNWIAAGHNLQPWVTDRQFHYATTFQLVGSPPDDTNTASWVPMFTSFPFQLLFTDPDIL